MRWTKIWTIFRKEFDDIIKSKYILLSLVIMPFFMIIVLPLVSYLPIILDPGSIKQEDVEIFLQFSVTSNWNELDAVQKMFVIFVEFNWIYYLLMPIILPSIIAADSFTGEKDRGTVEGLVAAPLTDTELYVGKISTSFIPTTVSMWLYSIPYMIITNIFSQRILHYNYLPNVRFFILIFLITPLVTLVSINVMIWASTRTSTTRDAQQFGSLLLIPLMLIVVNIAGLAVAFSNLYLLLGVLLMAVLAFLATKFGINLLDRERWLASSS